MIVTITVQVYGCYSGILWLYDCKAVRDCEFRTLAWNEHIRQITSKANSVKNFLQCNITRACPVTVKATCYCSMIRSILEYASIVWSPYTQRNIQLIESVQRRSARFTLNDYSPYNSVTNMLIYLDWNSLENRRNELRLQSQWVV